MDCSIMLVHCAIYHSIFAPFLNLYRLLEFEFFFFIKNKFDLQIDEFIKMIEIASKINISIFKIETKNTTGTYI